MLKIGHEVVRPGKHFNDANVTIGIPEELETTPGVPLNQREVDWYAREYPLESMNITERASRGWANAQRDQHIEMREIRKEHEKLNRPLIMASRATGELDPTTEPTGEDVGEAIKNKARELGFVEVGFTDYDQSPVLIPRAVFGEHAHFLGDSGSGKTSLGLCPLVEQLVAR